MSNLANFDISKIFQVSVPGRIPAVEKHWSRLPNYCNFLLSFHLKLFKLCFAKVIFRVYGNSDCLKVNPMKQV